MKNFTHPFLDQVFFQPQVSSTMLKAEQLIKSDQAAGNFLFAADTQTQGKGKNKNSWYSPAGGLWFTLGVYGFEFKPNYTLFCGLQLMQAMQKMNHAHAADCKIKWPNDIYFKDKKVAGIITRKIQRSNYYLTGIGIDTNIKFFPDELQNIATSLHLHWKQKVNNIHLLKMFLDNFADNLPEYLENYDLDLIYYHKNDYLAEKEVTVRTGFMDYKGKYFGIAKDGALLVKLHSGAIQPFYAGDIALSV